MIDALNCRIDAAADCLAVLRVYRSRLKVLMKRLMEGTEERKRYCISFAEPKSQLFQDFWSRSGIGNVWPARSRSITMPL